MRLLGLESGAAFEEKKEQKRKDRAGARAVPISAVSWDALEMLEDARKQSLHTVVGWW